MKISQLLVLSLIILQPVYCQLIRPNYIYEQIIYGIKKYYNNECILLIYATPSSEIIQDVDQGTRLKDLQEYFSKLKIRTLMMDIETFVLGVNESIYHIRRPLFVFLNDFSDIRTQFTTMIAPWTDMAYPQWLIFFRDQTTIEYFFSHIYIPFDCEFMISKSYTYSKNREIITEIYQIDRGKELREQTFAIWSARTGIEFPKLTLYQRRNNLHGHRLKVISIEDPPSSKIIRNERNKVIGLAGFFGGVIELLQESMNCTVIYQAADEWGQLLDNGTWTGAIGSLINGNSDILAAELLMTQQRLDFIKFTTPLYSTKCRTYIKRPQNSVLWDKFIMPFTAGIWITLGIIQISTTSSLLIIKYVSSKIHKDIEDTDRSQSYHVFFDVLGTLCGQGMDMSLLNSIRMVHFAIHLTGVVVMAAYSAALISSLAIVVYEKPFDSIEGLLRDGTYRFGMAQSAYGFFQNATDKVMVRFLNEVLSKEDALPLNYLVGLSQVCKENKYALMALDTAVFELEPSLSCEVIPLNTIAEVSISLALRPRNPFREIINNNILMMRNSGILRKLLDSIWKYPGDEEKRLWAVVEITDIYSLIAVVTTSSVLSIIMMCGERAVKIIKRMKRRKRKLASKRALKKFRKIELHFHNNFLE
ncbi:glutamate receptor ionotropic, delta-2-like [Chelonus insularis]|uniref:glutamate receptor ionotropic, delta-2-like n=1 Tax=Chelonus insularis TaxID=460826 RepID=UPI00158CC2C2|nr:glutamate receptor ionotropic, delta-2-like [Chelonus insularis]